MYREHLSEKLPEVRSAIEEAALRAGRDASSVTLVAVTKGHPLEAVEAALEAGLTDLGENRVEALEEKAARVSAEGLRWHLIGHVQSRKSARAAAAAHVVHSVDSVRLGRKLARAIGEQDRGRLPVLLQVNTSGEGSKGGFTPEGLPGALSELVALGELEIAGLMTMAPLTDDEDRIRTTFRRLRELSEAARREHAGVGRALSMGMTHDLRIAVEEGSTMVRVGTALFGERR